MGKISVISQTFVISFGCPLVHLHLLAMILTLLFVTFLCFVCYHYLSRIQHYKLAFRLKGPQAFPLIGNVPQLMFKSNQGAYQILQFKCELCKKLKVPIYCRTLRDVALLRRQI